MSGNGSDGQIQFPLKSLEPKALQALYHQVTGKTETTKKQLSGNVIITDSDISSLYEQIKQLIKIQNRVCEETVTVIVDYANDGIMRYSSWERYQNLRQPNPGITSEITIKFEVVVRISETNIDQRIIINVNIDSSLPVVVSQKDMDSELPSSVRYLMMPRKKWRTVLIEVDYVDFVLAKTFIHPIESWFTKLDYSSPNQESTEKMLKFVNKFQEFSHHSGRLSSGLLFLMVYYFSDAQLSLFMIALIFGASQFIFTFTNIAVIGSLNKLRNVLASKIIPSVILLDEFDLKAYNKISDEMIKPSSKGKIFKLILSFSASVLASIVAAWIIAKNPF